MVEPVGAKLELHGFTWSHESQPSEVRPSAQAVGTAAARKPWWKFW